MKYRYKIKHYWVMIQEVSTRLRYTFAFTVPIIRINGPTPSDENSPRTITLPPPNCNIFRVKSVTCKTWNKLFAI